MVNNLLLGPGSCNVWPERPAIYENTLTFSGVFPSGCGEKFRYFSLLSANDYVQTLFRQFWQQVGGTWSGSVRDAELPAMAKLFATWESPPLSELIASLALNGIDGTMKKRLGNSPLAGRSHMKTGYIEGVPAMAGYTLDARGHMLAVVLIINHPGARSAQPVQDALLDWVHAEQTSR